MALVRTLVVGLIVGLALFSTGCATIIRGSTQDLTVTSNPSGAYVKLSTGQTGMTPATFTGLSRKRDLVVEVSMSGYQTSTVSVTSGVSSGGAAGVVGNALVGGIIGVGVDVATGASLSLTPNPVHVVLIPQAMPPSPAPRPPLPSESAQVAAPQAARGEEQQSPPP